MVVARPYARGRNRLSVGPSSTQARATTRFSGIACFSSALAIAEFRTFASVRLGASGENARIRRASSTWRPRIRSIERRSFLGEIRMYFALAFACTFVPLLERRASLGVVAVRAEDARERELPELVA